MAGTDWPVGWDRTPPRDGERNRNLQASLADTTAAIETEMQRIEVAACSLMTMIVPILLFHFLHRYYEKGMVAAVAD